MEDPTMVHYKIFSRCCHVLLFYLLVFARIHYSKYIWTRRPGPPAKKQPHNIKDPVVYLQGNFLSLFALNPSGGFATKKLFL